jgi:hypothetical protein
MNQAICALERANFSLTEAKRARAVAYAAKAPDIMRYESVVSRARLVVEQARAICEKARGV